MRFGIRESILLLILVAIPLGAWRFVFRPRSLQAASVQKQIEAKQSKLRQLNLATGKIGNLKNQIDELEKGITFFQSKLPSEKEIDKVLEEVWRLAEANKLVTKNIRALARNNQNTQGVTSVPHAEQPIGMQLQGDFMGFYSFLQALENQPRIMRIHKLVLSKPPKSPDGYVQADLTLSIFFEGTNKEKP